MLHHPELLYKERKESFVSGLRGTSHAEVFVLAQCLPLLICFCHALKLVIPSQAAWNTPVVIVFEATLILAPLVAVCTSLVPPQPLFWLLLALNSLIILANMFHACSCHSSHEWQRKLTISLQSLSHSRRPYISMFRGGLMLYTCLCILAVDFPAFPRRYAKAEAYGSGLMDVGVGGIILASGLVSGKYSSKGDIDKDISNARQGWFGGVKKVAPCLLLGGARFVSVKLLGYQEVVDEYGVHWNFFMTIACVSLIVHLAPIPPPGSALAALAVTLLHQITLSFLGLGGWALGHHRGHDLISQNKEGIVSLVGYYALFLAGSALSHHMKSIPVKSKASTGIFSWFLKWTIIDLSLWIATFAVEHFVETRARRTCNAAYVLWTTSLCLSILIAIAAGQVHWSLSSTFRSDHNNGPLLLNLANQSMLPIFLIANLVTGAVNLSLDTLSTSDSSARVILLLYMLAVSGATFAISLIKSRF